MRFAKTVFWIAAIWGLFVISPLFFIFDLIGKQNPPPITHPGFYYGFATSALAWQIAFAVIATNPVRLRPLMIPSIVEKFGYFIACAALFSQGRILAPDLAFACADLVLGTLFVVAFLKTPKVAEPA